MKMTSPAISGLARILALAIGTVCFGLLCQCRKFKEVTKAIAGDTISKADINKVKMEMQDVRVAIGHFRTEYLGRFPSLELPIDIDFSQQSKGAWLDALEGAEPSLNPRDIQFISYRAAVNHKLGIETLAGESRLVDAWGNLYQVVWDTDGSNDITNPEFAAGVRGANVPEKIAIHTIIYSGGPDGNLETWEDNVCSWR